MDKKFLAQANRNVMIQKQNSKRLVCSYANNIETN